MAKMLRCDDLIPGCSFVAKGANEDEVLANAAEHALSEHGIAEIPAEMMAQAKAAIREDRRRDS